MMKVIVRLPVALHETVYRKTLGVRGGISGYFRSLAERDTAAIVPEIEREKERT